MRGWLAFLIGFAAGYLVDSMGLLRGLLGR